MGRRDRRCRRRYREFALNMATGSALLWLAFSCFFVLHRLRQVYSTLLHLVMELYRLNFEFNENQLNLNQYLTWRYGHRRRLNRPLLQMAEHGGGTVSRRTTNKKLTKLY